MYQKIDLRAAKIHFFRKYQKFQLLKFLWKNYYNNFFQFYSFITLYLYQRSIFYFIVKLHFFKKA